MHFNFESTKHFSAYCEDVERQIKSELHEAINEVFKKVADWFQVPQTGFISASVRELCQIILIELHRINHIEFTGNALDIKYTGISVHRLYDCLAVLLKNAHMYGEENTVILVNVCANRTSTNSALNIVFVDITSTATKEKYSEAKERISKAIESVETSRDMVTEGYTGIKKIKFITRTIEGFHTIRCDTNDDARKLKLCFSLHAETAATDFDIGRSS